MPTNYVIENGIDFYAELYKGLDASSSNTTEIQTDKCIITDTDLEADHVHLECGHKFNYGPLFKEIRKQKFTFATYTFDSLDKFSKLILSWENKKDFIKCPYCRNVQFTLLPLNIKYDTKCGINEPSNLPTDDINYPFPKKTVFCQLIHKQKYHFSKSDEYKCYHIHKNGAACKNSFLTPLTVNDEPIYSCIVHASSKVDEIVNQEKQKKMAEYEKKYQAKKKKTEEKHKKLDEKKIKLEAKKKILEEKKKKLEDKINNVVINNVEFCQGIYKSGPKKGSVCGCKAYKDNLCKRHLPKQEYIIV